MVRSVVCIVVVGMVAGIGSRAWAQESDSAHAEYRRAMHKAASRAVGQLIDSGDWAEQALSPKLSLAGDGALSFFAPPEGYVVTVAGGVEGVTGWLRQFAAAFGLYSPRSDVFYTHYKQSSVRTYLRFSQSYGGVPVEGAEIVVQTNGNTIETVVSSVMRDDFALDTAPESLVPLLSPSDAESFAIADSSVRVDAARGARLQELAQVSGEWPAGERQAAEAALNNTVAAILSPAELVIIAPELLGMNGSPRLAYRSVVRSAPVPLVDEYVYIDARTGETIHTASRIRGLIDRNIYDANGSTTKPGSATRTEGQSPVSDADVDVNYDVLEAAYDYFHVGGSGYIGGGGGFGSWTSYDDADSSLYSYVDWGTVGYAAWDPVDDSFIFGQAAYARADDIVGHEYTHAVIAQPAHWQGHTTTGETGAIAESICDFFGEMVDVVQYNGNDSGDPDWVVGEDLTGGAVRDMAEPENYGQPSWRGASDFYTGTNATTFAYTNSGVINKLWYLLAEGTDDPATTTVVETFQDVEVVPLDLEVLEKLVWNLLPALPDTTTFEAFADILDATATALSFTSGEKESVANACLAVGITPLEAGGPSSGEKALQDVYHIYGQIEASGTGYDTIRDIYTGLQYKKAIPYKIYVPADGLDLDGSDPGTRAPAYWPLDVIIFSHGAGMNREIGAGVDGSSELGLAEYWAQKGYIVVVPTYRKRHKTGDLRWEPPYIRDRFNKAASDLGYVNDDAKVGQFFGDRLRDLKTVYDSLYEIINDDAEGAFNATTSKVALAGHSFGAVTTVLASGIQWNKGGVLLDMEASPYNFRRIHDNGTPSDISDDWGPFLDVEAFLPISETMFDGAELGDDPTVHTMLDVDRPNLTGRDMITKPFMLMAGEIDFLEDLDGAPITSNLEDARYYDSVIKPFGLHEFTRYGVVVAGANHLTPVGWFHTPIGIPNINSWLLSDIWTTYVLPKKNTSEFMPEENAFFDGGTVQSKLQASVNLFFRDVSETQGPEEARLREFQKYTLAFWDSYLSVGYDGVADMGSDFLGDSDETHMLRQYVWYDEEIEIPGFVRRDPVTDAFIVRDSSGVPLVQFQENGDILIHKGGFESGYSSFSESSIVPEFFVKKHDGTIEAEIDAATGWFRIRGGWTPYNSSTALTASKEFAVRSADDTGTSAQIVLKDDGSLNLRGYIFTKDGPVPTP